MCNNIPSDKLTFCVEWLVKQFIARFWFDHVHKIMVTPLIFIHKGHYFTYLFLVEKRSLDGAAS